MTLQHFHSPILQESIAGHQAIGHSSDKALWQLQCIDPNLQLNQMPTAFVQLEHQIHVKTCLIFRFLVEKVKVIMISESNLKTKKMLVL